MDVSPSSVSMASLLDQAISTFGHDWLSFLSELGEESNLFVEASQSANPQALLLRTVQFGEVLCRVALVAVTLLQAFCLTGCFPGLALKVCLRGLFVHLHGSPLVCLAVAHLSIVSDGHQSV